MTTDPMDDFGDFTGPGAAPKLRRPTFAQLTTGNKKGKRTYAPGTEDEVSREISGRLIILVPKKVETVPNLRQPGKTQDRMTADVIVVNGEPITQFVPDEGEPEDLPEPLKPVFVIQDMYVSATKVIGQCRNLDKTLKPRVLGVLGKIPASRQGNKMPFVLFEFTPEEAKLAKDAWAFYRRSQEDNDPLS